MQIKILDNIQANVLGIMNNSLPNALQYYDDEYHGYTAEGSSTYEFSVRKHIDGQLIKGLGFFKFGNHISFIYAGKKRMMKMLTVSNSLEFIRITCIDITCELISEDTEIFTADAKHTLSWYFNHFTMSYGNVIIGINEVADSEKLLSWDGKQSKLTRLLSIVTKFDAECEFDHTFNQNGSLKNIVVNIFRKNNKGLDQGVGTNRTDVILKIGKDIDNITRNEDGKNVFTAIHATGKDGLVTNGVALSITNDNGQEEFYLRYGEGNAYAPIAADKYPANIPNAGTLNDKWTLRTFETDYTTQADLGAYMIRTLQANAYPIIEFILDMNSGLGWEKYGLGLGDTIKIVDMNFSDEGLILLARVSEMIISFSDPTRNKILLSNFIELKSKLSTDILKQMNSMIESATPYLSTVVTQNSIIFKKSTDFANLSLNIMKGANDVSESLTGVDYAWYVGTDKIASTKTMKLTYNMLTADTNVVTVIVKKGEDTLTKAQLSVTKVSDGISPINLVIESSNGYQFKNNVINTTFTAILYQNNKEIDSDSTQFSYVWSKTNSDGTADTAWNLAHQSSQKSITISNSDVLQRATFSCTAEPLN